MDLPQSLEELGVPPKAAVDEIERAYRMRSRALKTLLLGSDRCTLKDQRRHELRRLVVSRAVALGRPLPPQWEGDRLNVSATRLRHRLERLPLANLNRVNALAFFGLTPDAKPRTAREIYQGYQRALVRAFAKAHDDAEMEEIRRARRKLRTIRNFAVA